MATLAWYLKVLSLWGLVALNLVGFAADLACHLLGAHGFFIGAIGFFLNLSGLAVHGVGVVLTWGSPAATAVSVATTAGAALSDNFLQWLADTRNDLAAGKIPVQPAIALAQAILAAELNKAAGIPPGQATATTTTGAAT